MISTALGRTGSLVFRPLLCKMLAALARLFFD